jgi:hypothetical protein
VRESSHAANILTAPQPNNKGRLLGSAPSDRYVLCNRLMAWTGRFPVPADAPSKKRPWIARLYPS